MTPLFDNICSLPLNADLFTQAIHPTLPIVSIGLSTGHVETYRLPPVGEEDNEEADVQVNGGRDDNRSKHPAKRVKISGDIIGRTQTSRKQNDPIQPILFQSALRRSSTASENGLGSIESIWSTRRHKGSCRTLAFNHDGNVCYSAGTDGLVKSFDTLSGRVISKIAIPVPADEEDIEEDDHGLQEDAPTYIHALSPQGLLLATDSGRVHYFDLRQDGSHIAAKPTQTWRPHGNEHVNDLVPLPASESSTSGFPKSWVSVGGTTLAVTDMRKGVLKVSEPQDVELTSICFVDGLKKGGTSVGEKVCVGQSDGVVSLWERGVWGDLDERIVVDRMEAALESVVEVPAAEFGYGRGKLRINEKVVACGLEDGSIRFIRIGRNGVIGEWDLKHDEIDGAVGLGFDVGGRMVSGGGNVLKVWTEAKGIPGGGRNGSNRNGLDNVNGDGEDEDDDDNDNDDGWEDDDSGDEEEEEKEKSRSKRKRNKGKDKSGGKVFEFNM